MKNALTLLILFFSISLLGQNNGRPVLVKISGKVIDESGEAIPYASIAVHKSKDSSFVKGSASDNSGAFEIEVRKGADVFIKVSFLSYETKVLKDLNTSSNVHLSSIVMSENSVIMDEVEVVGEKANVELKLDKRVYNVSKDVTNQGANASEILEKIGSVDVDVEGNVSLRGSSNVRVLINGKPNPMFTGDLANALKQLQGEEIESIEIVTNPSAKYDAEGEAGIINIILKKEKENGISGSVNATIGYPGVYKGGSYFTIKRKKFTVTHNLSVGSQEGIGGGLFRQNFRFPDTTYSYTRTREHNYHTKYISSSLTGEYYIDDHHTFGASGTYSLNDHDNFISNTYEDINSDGIITSEEERRQNQLGQNIFVWGKGYLYKTFDRKGQEWNTDFQSYFNEGNSGGNIYTRIGDRTFSDERSMKNYTEIQYTLQSDYIYPVDEVGKLEFGINLRTKTRDEDFDVEMFDGADWVKTENDNHLVYKENISAAYMMYGNEFGKVSYQFGMRGENSEISTHLLTTDEYNPRTYMNWFPSMHFSYEVSENTFYQFGYSKRIDRPRSWWLNPFFSVSDNRLYFRGNPNLDPSYIDSYELTFLKKPNRSSFMASLYYRYTTDNVEWMTKVDSLGITFTSPYNVGVSHSTGLEFNLSHPFTKKFFMTANLNLFDSRIFGTFDGQDFNGQSFNWTSKLNARWKLPHSMTLQGSYRYRSPEATLQGRRLSMSVFDTGLSKEVLKKKATLTFNVRDVFNSRVRRMTSSGEFFDSENEFQWRQRTFLLSFNYRFNQKPGRGNRSGGAPSGGGGMVM